MEPILTRVMKALRDPCAAEIKYSKASNSCIFSILDNLIKTLRRMNEALSLPANRVENSVWLKIRRQPFRCPRV